MEEKSTEAPFGSRTIWARLEAMARERIQAFLQVLLEEEVTELVGRAKSERRASVNGTPVYRNGHGKPRKLSLSVQLTDPSQYEGCDLQFQVSDKVGVAPRKRGTVIAFPSFFLHRVTPIISGTRKALVAWATGPEFR